MNGNCPSALLVRIAVLGVVVVFFQIGVVSEVPVFGVSADLSPLLVAFVGLLCGSTIGAATGFAVGLLVDLALRADARRDLADAARSSATGPGACANCATRRRR